MQIAQTHLANSLVPATLVTQVMESIVLVSKRLIICLIYSYICSLRGRQRGGAVGECWCAAGSEWASTASVSPCPAMTRNDPGFIAYNEIHQIWIEWWLNISIQYTHSNQLIEKLTFYAVICLSLIHKVCLPNFNNMLRVSDFQTRFYHQRSHTGNVVH